MNRLIYSVDLKVNEGKRQGYNIIEDNLIVNFDAKFECMCDQIVTSEFSCEGEGH